MYRILFFSILFPFFVVANAQQVVIDESYLDPEFLQFKLDLTEAVLQRDVEKLRPLVHHTVTFSYDAPEDESGEAFIELMKQNGENWLWDELYDLISWGFKRERITEGYPEETGSNYYYHAPSFGDDFDWHEKLVITGRNVNIRSAPGTHNPVIAQATWQVFPYHSVLFEEVVAEELTINHKGWYELVMPNGNLGYVIEDYVSARILAWLDIRKFEDGWKLVSFYHPPGC